MILRDFIPAYDFVPDMEDLGGHDNMWPQRDIIKWGTEILDNDKYYDNDASWLTDLRLFYIKENK